MDIDNDKKLNYGRVIKFKNICEDCNRRYITTEHKVCDRVKTKTNVDGIEIEIETIIKYKIKICPSCKTVAVPNDEVETSFTIK